MTDPLVGDVLLTRPPFFVIGALLGLTVVGVLATLNQQLGALGGYSAVFERASGRTRALGWKAWFLLGIFAGALIFRLLAGGTTAGEGYGWLTRTFADDWVVGPLLLVGGALIGFGAKTAGGCTSGNGICGTALGSAASFVATATFMAVAVGVTFFIDLVIA
ncbi:MAG: uncharacterized protein QOD71_2038 [Thermoleophilaceae bacterium]|jgi:uncharacterized membrane protein YedE/YeeE|nr:uncharacterized protein [Thermoleophilaceae bacterium]